MFCCLPDHTYLPSKKATDTANKTATFYGLLVSEQALAILTFLHYAALTLWQDKWTIIQGNKLQAAGAAAAAALCINCDVPRAVLHILVECPCYSKVHLTFHLHGMLPDMLVDDYHNVSKMLAFLNSTGLPDQFNRLFYIITHDRKF